MHTSSINPSTLAPGFGLRGRVQNGRETPELIAHPARRSRRRRCRSAPFLVLVSALSGGACSAPGTGSEPVDEPELVAPDGSIDLNRFYTAAETDRILAEYERLYPTLAEVNTIGNSLRGHPLNVITITNETAGPAFEKPALYVDGGIHARELTASAVATHLIAHLLTQYGRDERVTALLDTRAVYVRPKFNPDGSDLALLGDHRLRSTIRPVDDDADGQADEDPADDLNGDGRISRMRYRDPDGPMVIDPEDDRIMVLDEDRELPGTRFRVVAEGRDDDGDGEINEDGLGGIDMNRNFPRNWERWHIQPGAGNYPLSEPETRATVEFIDSHRNITGIVHGHTSGGFVYRLPSASAPSLFPERDLALIQNLGAEYTRATGRPVVPSATHPTMHRYGTLISWGYWDHGIVGWVPEFSPGPSQWVTDYDGDGEISEPEQHRFNDEELGGWYFTDWEDYEHPDLGAVEIGGWHELFWGQNPPREFLEAETALQLDWILYLAEQSPLIQVSIPTVTRHEDDTYGVEATVSNIGYLPTSLTDRGAEGALGADGILRHQVVRPLAVILEMEGAEVVGGQARLNLPHLAGSNPFLRSATERERRVGWRVRPTGEGQLAVRVVAISDKGGTVRSAWAEVER